MGCFAVTFSFFFTREVMGNDRDEIKVDQGGVRSENKTTE